jgi:hypothetical protein
MIPAKRTLMGAYMMAAEELSETRKYKMAWWQKWPLFLLAIIAIESMLVFPQITGIVMNQRNQDLTAAFALAAGFVIILSILLMLLIGEVMFSYLQVSPEGIQYRFWPFYYLEFDWDDIESITQSRLLGIFPYDSMNVTVTNRSGYATTAVLKQSISLTDFQGWPKGQLAATLREYAPHLFEASPKPD